jgi:hypothetical protein
MWVVRGTFRSLVADKGLFARLVREGGFTEPITEEEEEEAKRQAEAEAAKP